MSADADLHFYFDPVCPFAWMTSKWVRTVAAQRDYQVDWRFISLRILNAHIDYASHFPPNYEEGHTAGLRLLRVAARVREEHGRDAVGPVTSRLPSPDAAAALWDHIVGLASFPGFAELKRSLRERPQLASFGVDAESVGKEEDWHGGSRRLKK